MQGGQGYFSGNYWHQNYWHVNYWASPAILSADLSGQRVLMSIEPDSGARYYSVVGVRHPSRFYRPQIESFGTLTRAIPQPVGFPILSDLTVTWADHAEIKALRTAEALRGRPVSLWLGPRGGSFSRQFTQIYNGEIKGPKTGSGGQPQLVLRDFTYDVFRGQVPGRLTTSEFPNLPAERKWDFKPIHYGILTSVGSTNTGRVPCPYVDTVNFIYLVAQHACKEVTNIYRYGVLLNPAAYTLSEVVIGGQTHTIITFPADQEDPSKSSETTITADVQGITADGTSAGALLVTPMDCLEHYLGTYAGVSAGLLDAPSIAETAGLMGTRGWICSASIVEACKHEEVFTRFLMSFDTDGFVGTNGKLKFRLFDLATALATDCPIYDETKFILEDTYEDEDNPDEVNQVLYRYRRDWIKNQWLSNGAYDDAAGQAEAGEIFDQEVPLWYVDDAATAAAVAQARQYFQRRVSRPYQLSLPSPEVIRDLDLGGIFKLRHSRKPGAPDELCRVYGLGLDLANLKVDVQARGTAES